jgi:hypothetical protein
MPSSDPPLKRSYHTKGFGLGTAILSASQLKEVHTLITQAFGRLKDPTIEVLRQALEERLAMANIAVDSLVPLRAFANRSIIDARASALPARALVHQAQLQQVEEAILQRRAIQIKVPGHTAGAGKPEITVWPLQILFHNIGWYLAYEATTLDALLTVARLDRLELISANIGAAPRPLAKMQQAQKRLEHLCRRTGGVFLGGNHHQQRELAVANLSEERLADLLRKGTLIRVRFHCTERIHTIIREGNNRYPSEQMLFGEALSAGPVDPTHPHPVEFLLPAWTVELDRDFRRWLFGFGGEIRIETPEALRQEHRAFGAAIAASYPSP